MSPANGTMSPVNIVRGLLAILILMLGVYLFMSIEITEKVEKRPSFAEFYDKPFEALSRYLQVEKVEVEIIDGYYPESLQPEFFDAMSAENAVVFRFAEMQISEELTDSLYAWVERGGNLIVSGVVYSEPETIPSNGLFRRLGVRYHWPEEPSYQPTEFEIENDVSISIGLETRYSFYIETLNDDDDFWASTDTGMSIAQKAIGEGFVTIMADVDIWTNSQINNLDNIVFADFLLSGIDKVIIYSTSDKPHWLVILAKYTPGTLLFAGLLVFLTLWHFAIRYGSIQKPQSHNASAFILHLKASANYYWQRDKHRQYLLMLRNKLRQRICQKYLLRSEEDIPRILPQLTEKTELPADVILNLIADGQPASEQDYVRLVKQLQIIRNQL